MSDAFRIGLFGIGLDTYWLQFPGLEERLRGYLATVEDRIAGDGVEVVNAGLIDTVDKAFAAGRTFRRAGVQVVFLYVTTYALSATVLPVLRQAGVPVIILNLQPEKAIDYAAFNRSGDRTAMTGNWLAYCASCPVPEIANLLSRTAIPFHQITGVLDQSDPCWTEIAEWIAAARAAATLETCRIGLLGRYYNGMLDIYSDLTGLVAAFGGHFEILEMDELAALRHEVGAEAVEQRIASIREEFDVQSDCEPAEIARAATTSLALDRLVEKKRLGAMAYYYESVPGHEHEDVISSVIVGCSILTARNVPIAGEYEVKNALAMKIMDIFGAGGSFTEYYAIDFEDDIVLMGHDGPGHIRIGEGKAKIRPLQVYHGKVGSGLSIEMSVKHGPVTLLSVVQDRSGVPFLLYAEGKSEPGPILEIGNTNSRYRFPPGARGFVESWNRHGPAHHCAVGIGHVGGKIEKLASLLRIRSVKVC